MMPSLDLTSGKRVLRCDEDGRPFVSDAHRDREVDTDVERTSA
jgi:hypothetical protein